MPMKLDYVFAISGNLPESMKRSLIYPPFSPQNSAHVQEGSVMKQVKKNDILLFYPYESMNPFLRLIKEASTDPNVLTIKITIYPPMARSTLSAKGNTSIFSSMVPDWSRDRSSVSLTNRVSFSVSRTITSRWASRFTGSSPEICWTISA